MNKNFLKDNPSNSKGGRDTNRKWVGVTKRGKLGKHMESESHPKLGNTGKGKKGWGRNKRQKQKYEAGGGKWDLPLESRECVT